MYSAEFNYKLKSLYLFCMEIKWRCHGRSMCMAIEKLAVPKSVPCVALAVVAKEKEEVNVVLKSTACPIESWYFWKRSPKKGAVGGHAASKNLATPVVVSWYLLLFFTVVVTLYYCKWQCGSSVVAIACRNWCDIPHMCTSIVGLRPARNYYNRVCIMIIFQKGKFHISMVCVA